MKSLSKIGKAALGLALGSAMVFGSLALADTPEGRGGGCNCLDVWRPVICSNGQIYSNFCYAGCAHATGCVPWGGDDI